MRRRRLHEYPIDPPLLDSSLTSGLNACLSLHEREGHSTLWYRTEMLWTYWFHSCPT